MKHLLLNLHELLADVYIYIFPCSCHNTSARRGGPYDYSCLAEQYHTGSTITCWVEQGQFLP